MEKKNLEKLYIPALFLFALLAFARWFCWTADRQEEIALAAYLLVSIGFIAAAYENAKARDAELGKIARNLGITAMIVLFPMFEDGDTVGQIDLKLMLLVLAAFLVLLSGRMSWLLLPLTLAGTFLEPGFVLRYLPMILAVLAVEGREEKKKRILFHVTWIANVTLAVIYQLFVEFTLLPREAEGNAAFQLILFVAFFAPYLILGHRFFVRLKDRAVNRGELAAYRFWEFAPLLLLPEFLLKNSYGIYCFDLLVYELLTSMSLVSLGGERVQNAMKESDHILCEKRPMTYLLLFYPLIFMPFSNVSIFKCFDWITNLLP